MVTESEKSKHDMLRAMRKHIRENGITDFTDFQDWCNELEDLHAMMKEMRQYIIANNVAEFYEFQLWCDENNERWAEALDSGCAIAIEKFIADWNGRADANRWKHAAQPDDNIWDNELK